MGLVCCVAKVQGDVIYGGDTRSSDVHLVVEDCKAEDARGRDEAKAKGDNEDACTSFLANLPTELLVKILSYVSTRDKLMMRYVSRRGSVGIYGT